MGEGGVKNPEKFADVVYGWSLIMLKNFFCRRPRILSMTIRAIKANFVPPIFTASGETHRRRLLHPSNLSELLLLLQNLHQITKELLMVTVPEK